MDERSLTDWFVRLQPRELVEILRDFLGAEANRVGGSVGVVHFSTSVNIADGGVDGRTGLPEGARDWFLPGPMTWQVKSGKKFDTDEVDKPKTQEDIAEGCDYVLCWALDDPITNIRDETERALTDRIKKKHPDRRAFVVTVPDLVRMAQSYPSVVQRHKGPTLAGLPLEQWAPSLQVDAYSYIADEVRTQLMTAIREFCTATDESASHVHVVGDTGVGKSRMVYEALNVDGVRQLVVVTPDYELINLDGLRRATEPDDARLILVVDDVTPAQIESLKTIAAAARGRLRLITIGDREADRSVRADQTRLDVPPLSNEGIRELLAAQGLSQGDIDAIEELAHGYPRLAVEIGHAFRRASSATTTIDLLSTSAVHNLLEGMIPDPQLRESLAVLALFDRVGFEGEVADELTIIAEHFNLDRLRLQSHIRQETDRFISTAGRYRRVTPLVLGIWLVRELVRQQPSAVVDSIEQLPDTLAAAFRRQVRMLGMDAHIETVLEEISSRQMSRFRDANGQLTELGASFVHSLAFSSPMLASRLATQLLGDASRDLLHSQPAQVRRHLVWALTYLLWFKTTFDAAAHLLLRLAEAENETYGNNATEELAGFFRSRLGGTEVPYDERLAWWDTHWESANLEQRRVLLACLGKGLDEHEMRVNEREGTLLHPREWRPSTVGDLIETKRALWTRLLETIRADQELRDSAVRIAQQNVRSMASYPFAVEMLPQLVSVPGLSASERSGLNQGLQHALEYEGAQFDPERIQTVEESRQMLAGTELASRLALLLATPPWDLDPSARSDDRPQVLVDVATEILGDAASSEAALRAAVNASDTEANTSRLLGVIIGELDQSRSLQHLVDDESVRAEYAVGYVRGLSKDAPDRANEHVHAWIEQGRFDEAIYMIDMLEATPDRAQAAIEAADRAREANVPTPNLGYLAFGSWLAPLPPDAALAIIQRLVDEAERQPDFAEVEAAVFSLWSYFGTHEVTPALREEALRVLPLAEQVEGHSGRRLAHLRNKLADQIELDPGERLEITLRVLERDFPSSEDLEALNTALPSLGAEVIPRICDWLNALDYGPSLHAEEAHIMTLIVEVFGAPAVTSTIGPLPSNHKARLLRHLDFNQEIPSLALDLLGQDTSDPIRTELTRRFLYPGKVVVGPYSEYLMSRRSLLEPLMGADSSQATKDWAREVDEILEGMIRAERTDEDEERR